MSGILALLRTDGAPVEPQLVQRLTDSLALRGPDAHRTWCGGRVALGHTLLRTTDESEHEHQPLSLDGQAWIVADGRVDARRELVRELGNETESLLLQSPDVELILRAYLHWGEACVEHLLGDFAFAIWDSRRQRLFCARDHMGVKPFYYASVGPWLLVGSTIECLRRHPQVSDRLQDLAIADFLLFGFNQDAETTSFHDIQRLPPAHMMTWSDQKLIIRRFWTLPIEEPLYLRGDRDYVDRYKVLVNQAVSDRLRTDRVSVFMSGGLDSSGLAATASNLLRGGSKPVQAFTFVFDSLIPDSEREYAGLVACDLGVPIHFYPLDQNGWRPEAARSTPEPTAMLTDRSPELRCYREMAARSRVAFLGEGPDNALLYEWKSHLRYMLRKRRFARLATDIGKHFIAHRRVPILPTIPRMVRDRRKWRDFDPVFPPWLAQGLIDRLELVARWQSINAPTASRHPIRPKAYASLLTPQWQYLFEMHEPAYTGVAMEVRHPYVDVRVLGFLLSIPALPWCRVKHIQREALRGVVRDAVHRRPKSPLAGNPDYARFLRHGLPAVCASDALAAYGHALKLSLSNTMAAVDVDLRLVALSHWLAAHDSNLISSPKDNTMDKQTRMHEAPKKNYASPEFKAYGSLAHITAAVGGNGAMDGAGTPPMNTRA